MADWKWSLGGVCLRVYIIERSSVIGAPIAKAENTAFRPIRKYKNHPLAKWGTVNTPTSRVLCEGRLFPG